MTRALIFDSFFDKHRGVIAYVRVFAGKIKKGDDIHFLATKTKITAQEVGFFTPELTPSEAINNGEVGYIVTGLKELDRVRVGDTIAHKDDKKFALPGYKKVEPKVFSSIFPIDAGDYPKLRDAIAKLTLNDASLTHQTESIPALGFGFRCGFLGLLHMDIVQERLSREFDLNLIITTPSVEYHVINTKGEEISVRTPAELPDPSQITEIREPIVKIEIMMPAEYIGSVIELIVSHRGSYTSINELSSGQMQIGGKIPLSEIIVDFYDMLKSSTKGYATVSYEPVGFSTDDLVKVDILVNKEVVAPLSVIVHQKDARNKGRHICEKLKELIPRQQFEISLQAAIGARVIARETIKPYRKDVTAKLYGGDMSRRKKLLEKQKKGKKRMKMVGNVEIPQSAFLNVLKK